MSDRQQIPVDGTGGVATAIMWEVLGLRWPGESQEQREHCRAAAKRVTVAADRAGYERCKRDAATAIGTLEQEDANEWMPDDGYLNGLAKALAVVAALDATQATSLHETTNEGDDDD